MTDPDADCCRLNASSSFNLRLVNHVVAGHDLFGAIRLRLFVAEDGGRNLTDLDAACTEVAQIAQLHAIVFGSGAKPNGVASGMLHARPNEFDVPRIDG